MDAEANRIPADSALSERVATAVADGSPGVRARGLVKWFGRVQAVRGIDLALPERGVCGLLGPNGAGKTTTIRMIAGVLAADAGELEVAGHDARRDGARLRAAVGYLPESAPLYPELTVEEYLGFRAGLLGLSRADARRDIDAALSRCDVAHVRRRPCGTLSKGTQQRVGLAATILGAPRVVILDEPSVGLDPAQTLAFRTLVRELGETRLVLFSSHLLSEVESVATELAVIAFGRLLAHEPIATFRSRAGGGARFVVETERPIAGESAFAALADDVVAAPAGDGWTRTEFRARGEGDPREALGRYLVESRNPVRALARREAGLESIFVSLVEAARAAEERR